MIGGSVDVMMILGNDTMVNFYFGEILRAKLRKRKKDRMADETIRDLIKFHKDEKYDLQCLVRNLCAKYFNKEELTLGDFIVEIKKSTKELYNDSPEYAKEILDETLSEIFRKYTENNLLECNKMKGYTDPSFVRQLSRVFVVEIINAYANTGDLEYGDLSDKLKKIMDTDIQGFCWKPTR